MRSSFQGLGRGFLSIAAALWLIVALIMLAGCSLFGAPLVEKAGDVVRQYCEEPLGVRVALRDLVNKESAPHAVRVTCDGDPPDSPAAPPTGASNAPDPRNGRARTAIDLEAAYLYAGGRAHARAGPGGRGDARARRAPAGDSLPGGAGP